ncbi:MAG: Gfo/Idh/MocA family oxidoreductase, partial [Acidimicrobiia bacterium]|nr:Gfo/Idh/MocA family oxidoreductase [Acidimicrobiia bacterium]
MEPVRIAVIGAGYWGPNLIRNLTAFPGTTVPWVCDTSLSTAERAITNTPARATSNIDDVLADPDVHGVAVATPAGTHASIAQAALAAGKHVLVEKPLARTVADGEAMVRMAEDAGL